MNKTVLITGARRGLGKELTEVFAEAGYGLILASKNSVELTHDGAPIYTGDIRHPKTIKYLRNAADLYDIDVLINNAAIYLNKPFEETTEDEIEEVIGVNLLAPIRLTKAIWPIFKSKGSGTVVNINSLAGQGAGMNESIYCASKFGLRGFSEALQFDATKSNIRVINVTLGSMKTEMSDEKDHWYNFIEPQEAATAIFRACNDYESLRITELNLQRSRY